jgi:nucleolar protein 56
MSKALYMLFESPTGYGVFKRESNEEVGAADVELQKSLNNFATFNEMLTLVSFAPFQSAENALEDCICVTEGLLSNFLQEFLANALPKKKKESGWELGVNDPKLGSAIHEALGIAVVSNESITEFSRLIRLHAEKLLPNHQVGDIPRAQCGLGHAFSRNKVKFNVHRSDNMIIQASALLEHMDGGVNQLGMRVKEWYGWHFPEMGKEIPDPVTYARVALLLQQRNTIEERDAEELKAALTALLSDDEALADRIFEKAVTSMGGDMAEVDWVNIQAFAERVVAMADYRTSMQQYLVDKMMLVAPNLTMLMGQQIGAKLISKSGSLTSLAKSPASTIQILGAEKALFRALKKKQGNTPKYGLIFHSTFIQRAAKEHRGKISRYLANKTALAARIDCFMDEPSQVFGEKLREQVEGRLSFFDNGKKPQSNTEAMKEALEQYYAVVAKRERKAARAQARAEAAKAEADEEVPTKKSRKE